MDNCGAHFRPLATLCEPKNGLQTGPFGSQLHASDYVAEGIPVVMPQDIRAGRIRTDKVARVSPETAERLRRHRLRPGDIVFSRRGDVSRYAIVRDREAGFLCGTGCLRARLNDGIEPDYMAAVLEAGDAGRWLTDNAVGQTMPNLNVEIVGELPVPMLDATGQSQCARILRACRSAEARYARVAAAKRLLLLGLMQQLLSGRRRLPAFAHEAWEPTRFGEFLSESREPGSGGDTARKLTVKLYGKGITPKRETKSGSDQTQYYRRSAGQFIYSKLDFLNGAFGIVPRDLDGFESTLDLPAFDVSPSADARWLLHFCTREAFYRKYAKFANGGRKARRVNPADFLKIEEPIPSLDEQRAIADILDTAQREIELLEQLREQIQLQKRGLMQKLLTGEIRVKGDSVAI